MSDTALLERLNQGLPREADFMEASVRALVREVADKILAQGLGYDQLTALERVATSAAVKPGISNVLQLAVKLAKSRATLLAHQGLHVSVVMGAYGENVRLLPRGTEQGQDPRGEDFAVQKSLQLEWLFAGTGCTYQAYFVDDISKEDPVTSGQAIAEVINRRSLPHMQVLYLKDGVLHEKSGHDLVATVLAPVQFPRNTRKAGAIYYGAAKAIQASGTGDNHILVLTDCDLSFDLGQAGNLIAPIASGQAIVGAGSRRLPESILELSSSRNVRANTARYFRQLLLPGLLPKDTQCGAKAFAAAGMAKVLASGMTVYDLSFDIEVLTKFALEFGPEKIVPVAVACFDSPELSNSDSSVHWTIMRTQLAIAVANHTGSGPVFDHTVAVGTRLADSQEAWLALLAWLNDHMEVADRLPSFDPALLDEFEGAAIAA